MTASITLIIGCTSCDAIKDTYRRSSYLGDNPELTFTQREDIRKGRIHAGMTREMVRASLGEPTESSARTTVTGSVEEEWFYDRDEETITVEFQDGRVVGWTQRRKGNEE